MNGRRLYEEIGGVEERYLQEAAYYYVRKKDGQLCKMLFHTHT